MSSKVEFHIACRQLLDIETSSKSDHMVIIYVESKVGKSREWIEYERTETIENNVNPDFVKTFIMNYQFEEMQKIKFDVFDVDQSSEDLSKQDLIGTAECSLGSILADQNRHCELQLMTESGKHAGTIIVSVELIRDCTELLTFQFQGKGISKRQGVFVRHHSFLVFSKLNEDASFTVVHKTEVYQGSTHPTWKVIKIPVMVLCNGDYERLIKISCYDWHQTGHHKCIGEISTSIKEMKCNFEIARQLELINLKKKTKKKNYLNSGVLELVQFNLEAQPAFLDFIQAGTELCFAVGIDFSESNGDPNMVSSLHFKNPDEPNDYVKCLMSVGKIIEDYDDDSMFAAFGFGAKLPSMSSVMHDFPLNGKTDPKCAGVDGILQSYYETLDKVQLSDPAIFTPVIRNVSQMASEAETSAPGKKYFILMILTDGMIYNIESTKQAISEAAKLPISIVIVGIGGANFSSMRELYSVDDCFSSSERYADRDIVQFVHYEDISRKVGIGQKQQVDEEELARAVLEEIPKQLTSFMTMNETQLECLTDEHV